MDEIIIPIAQKFGIDYLWVKALIQQESSGNVYAIRYEPQYQYLFNPKAFAQHLNISQSTEETCQKMSWGLGQIMGAVARSQGHSENMGELFTPEVNIKHMCILIASLKRVSQFEDDIFSMYNGGIGAYRRKMNGVYPNQSYVDSVNRHLQSFKNP